MYVSFTSAYPFGRIFQQTSLHKVYADNAIIGFESKFKIHVHLLNDQALISAYSEGGFNEYTVNDQDAKELKQAAEEPQVPAKPKTKKRLKVFC